MGQFGWNFIAQGTGYSSHTRDRLQGHIRDRLQRPITAIADGNGGGVFNDNYSSPLAAIKIPHLR
jgi:hypothetical protein